MRAAWRDSDHHHSEPGKRFRVTLQDDIDLIDRLRLLPSETEWFDFKRNHLPPGQTGEYLSALANAASLARQPRGYLIFGIDDATRAVVGSTFDPYTSKAKGNQDLLPWLTALLQPNPGVDARIVPHPGGTCALLAVGPARSRPVLFSGTAYVRVGSSTTLLRNHPEKERALWFEGRDWSAERCDRATLADLDPDAIAKARQQFVVKNPTQAALVENWDDTTFLNKARLLVQGTVTNTAVLLLGRAESASLLSPAVTKTSWILKDAANRELDYAHFGPPLLLLGDRLLERVRNLTLRVMPSGTLFPQEVSQYDPWVLREALHNCFAHQDYARNGRIVVVEFPDRIVLTNVGDFLPGDIETVIRQDAPQPIYRNHFLADAMVQLGMIDTQGGGIKRMFESQRQRSFPLPDYDLSRPGQVTVEVAGRILDERYSQLLMRRSDLSLEQVMLLDRVQKKRSVTKEQHRVLKTAHLVEGRFPNLIVSATVARTVGETGRHIRESGLDKQYYLKLIEQLISQHGPVDRQAVEDLLLPKLPDRLDADQKRIRVQNLLQDLRRAGRIENRGTRRYPAWQVAASHE